MELALSAGDTMEKEQARALLQCRGDQNNVSRLAVASYSYQYSIFSCP